MIDRAVFEFMGMLYDLESGSCVDGQPAIAIQRQAATPAPAAQPAPQPQQVANNEAPVQTQLPDAQLPPAHGYGLHIASQHTVWQANQGWRELRVMYADVLAGRDARITRLQTPDRGVVFRLLAGSWQNEMDASSACEQIRSRGGDCRVTAYQGLPVMRS